MDWCIVIGYVAWCVVCIFVGVLFADWWFDRESKGRY